MQKGSDILRQSGCKVLRPGTPIPTAPSVHMQLTVLKQGQVILTAALKLYCTVNVHLRLIWHKSHMEKSDFNIKWQALFVTVCAKVIVPLYILLNSDLESPIVFLHIVNSS